MGKVKFEIRPWLSTLLDPEEAGILVLEENISEGITLRDLLRKLADEYKAFGDVFFDPNTGQPSSSVAIVINNMLMQSIAELDAELKDSDTITLLPFLDGG